METDLTYEELKDLIFLVENGDISAEDAWSSILLFQKKNKVKSGGTHREN